MDRIAVFLTDFANDPRALLWGLTLLVGMIAVIVTLQGASLVSTANNPLRRRLNRLADDGRASESVANRLGKKIDFLSPYVLPSKNWERNKIQTQLVHAGLRSPGALTKFFTLKIVFGVAFPLMAFFAVPFVQQVMDRQFSKFAIAFAILMASFVGMILPNMVLDRMVTRRKDKIQKAFPDALDMLVVCVEAGMGLVQGLQRVAQELHGSHPQLAGELELVNAEIRFGVDRAQALRNLGQRTGVEEIQVFGGLIGQTLKYGTNVANTLRIYSEDFRDKRMQRAEELAAKIGTKMIFPLVMCLFPSFFVVAIGPAIIKVFAAFGR